MQYATHGDSVPLNDPSWLSTVNRANYARRYYSSGGWGSGGWRTRYAVTQSSDILWDLNHLTEVGAYKESPSYFGTFDQEGNVSELIHLNNSVNGFRHGSIGSSWRSIGKMNWDMMVGGLGR